MSSDLAVSYEIVTHDRAGRERVHPYAGEDALGPGSVVLLGGRYWLVVRSFDDDSNLRSGFGWMCSLVDVGCYECRRRHLGSWAEPEAGCPVTAFEGCTGRRGSRRPTSATFGHVDLLRQLSHHHGADDVGGLVRRYAPPTAELPGRKGPTSDRSRAGVPLAPLVSRGEPAARLRSRHELGIRQRESSARPGTQSRR